MTTIFSKKNYANNNNLLLMHSILTNILFSVLSDFVSSFTKTLRDSLTFRPKH